VHGFSGRDALVSGHFMESSGFNDLEFERLLKGNVQISLHILKDLHTVDIFHCTFSRENKKDATNLKKVQPI
jgi:hypothetical protein